MDFKVFYKTVQFDIDNEIRTVYQATQGDTKSRGLVVDLIVGGVKTPVTTETMNFFALKPDGTRVMTAGVKEGTGFRIDFTNQTFAVPGVLLCALVLYGTNGEKIADKKFKMTVDTSLEDGAIVSEDERGILDRAFDLANDIVPRLEALDVPLLENLEQEVITARGTEATLGARLDSTDDRLDATEVEVTEIKVALKHIKLESWEDVQKAIRDGSHKNIFSVGDSFVATYAGVEYLWDVIGIDHDTPVDPRFTHSMTIQARDCLMNCVFDAPELLYFAETSLPVGSYKFYDSYNSKNYAFSIATPVPEGGGIIISAWGEPNTPTQVRTSDAAGVTLETIAVTESSVGTLITCNDLRRVRYGSNNYLESNVRGWLNSAAPAYVGAKKTQYDVLTTSAPYSTGGFLHNLDPELRDVIGPVKKQVAKNTVTDGGGQDTFEDIVFLLSIVEVYGGTEGDSTGEKSYEYYSVLAPSATLAELSGRIKYLSGASRHWWVRSPHVGYSTSPRSVHPTGGVSGYGAYYAFGLAPACTIY